MPMVAHRLTLLVPCQNWEEFPTSYGADQADELLSAWSVLWHPALIHAADTLPAWNHAGDPPPADSDDVVIVPSVSGSELPGGWLAAAERPGGRVFSTAANRSSPARGGSPAAADSAPAAASRRPAGDRRQLQEKVVATVLGQQPDVDAGLGHDFLVLGFCYLQVQLLNHQTHYVSQLDESEFERQLVDAAAAAVQGDRERAEQGLARLFDLLGEARDHYYPADTYVVDLTLVAATTLGQTLTDELAEASACRGNLLMEARLIEVLADQAPNRLARIRQEWSAGTIDLVGGHYAERDTALLPPEAILDELALGRSVYERHLGQTPTVYGRRRYGLGPVLPQLLSRFGYDGALFTLLDNGTGPQPEQSRTEWQSPDGSSIDCLAAAPLDASDPATYLNLSKSLSASIDRDFVATIVLVHWPGMACQWHRDLRRIAKYGPVLGKFVTLKEYFQATDPPGTVTRSPADQFFTPYLTAAVLAGSPDPVSRHVRAYGEHTCRQAARATETLATLASGPDDELPAPPDQSLRPRAAIEVAAASSRRTAAGCRSHKEAQAVGEPSGESPPPDSDSRRLVRAVRRLAHGLTAPAASGTRTATEPDGEGWLVVNPLGQDQVIRVADDLEDPGTAARRSSRAAVLLDVPGMGFGWLDSKGGASQGPPVRRLVGAAPVAERHVLRNEYFEVHFNPDTGGIRSISEYHRRGNLLSQQVAMRRPARAGQSPGPAAGREADYSRMVAESVEVAAVDRTAGTMASRGVLVDSDGRRLARFDQATHIERGSRVLRIELRLAPDQLPEGPPWESYYATRLAWPDPEADLERGVSGSRHGTSAERLEAPEWVEVNSAGRRIAIFGGGLPFHRRSAPGVLDTILLVAGETARTFHFGIGVGIDHPGNAAAGLAHAALPRLTASSCPAAGPVGWLVHVGAANVAVTHCETVQAERAPPTGVEAGSGQTWQATSSRQGATGLRIRLLETEGTAGLFQLRCPRAVARAAKTDFLGRTLDDLRCQGDTVSVNMVPHEWIQVEVSWK